MIEQVKDLDKDVDINEVVKRVTDYKCKTPRTGDSLSEYDETTNKRFKQDTECPSHITG